MSEAISPAACAALFTEARTHNGWLDRPVSDEQLREIYALLKMGPTSANCSPARFVFIRTPEGKEKLRPALSSGNVAKTLQRRSPLSSPGTARSMTGCRSCSLTATPAAGLPPARRWWKRPPFATVHCRRRT